MAVAHDLGVRIVPTHHFMAGLSCRLMCHSEARGGGLVLLLADDLDAGQAFACALEALGTLSARAWRARVAMARREADGLQPSLEQGVAAVLSPPTGGTRGYGAHPERSRG
jgi:hypothetical protein